MCGHHSSCAPEVTCDDGENICRAFVPLSLFSYLFFVSYFLQLTWQNVLALRCVAHYVHGNSEGGMAGGTAILVISHFFEKSPLLKTRGTLPPAASVPFSFLVLPPSPSLPLLPWPPPPSLALAPRATARQFEAAQTASRQEKPTMTGR